MAKPPKKMHPCIFAPNCPERTVNPTACPKCKQYIKQAAGRDHTWRLRMRGRYQRLDARLKRVEEPKAQIIDFPVQRRRRRA